MKLCMFRTVRLSIIRSLFAVHSAMVYVIQLCRQLSRRSICSCLTAFYKPAWHIPLLSVQQINSRWLTDELSETCRVSWHDKFVKLVHLVGFITKKFCEELHTSAWALHKWNLLDTTKLAQQNPLDNCWFPLTYNMNICLIYLCNKFHVPNSNDSLVITKKNAQIKKFIVQPPCYFTL